MVGAWLLRIAVLLATLVHGPLASAAAWEENRNQEIAHCQADELVTWHDGTDRPALSKALKFFYSHTSAPEWFNEVTVFQAVQKAADAWSQCGILASVEPLRSGMAMPEGGIAVVWSEAGSRHNFGLANLGNQSISLGPSAFQLLQTRNPAYDSRQTLQMVISHEMGHLFGVMAHSKRCVDVTSYYDDGRGAQCTIRGGATRPPGVEYRAILPTACDIQRCQAANGRQH
jgi:hypothetical protein